MLKRKSISVLGCGRLGTEAGKEFIRLGYKVHGSTTSPEKMSGLAQLGIEPYLLSVGREIDAPQLIRQNFFSQPLLLLNIPPDRRNDKVGEDYPRKIRLITEAARAYGTEKIIFTSSTGVYGNENREVTEEDELQPERAAGKALVDAENYLRAQKDLQITILRLAGLLGGTRKAGRFFAGKTNVKGGSAPVNMVCRQDCISVIRAVIDREVWGETFNVCADEHPSKKDFYVRKAIEEGFVPPVFAEEAAPAGGKTVSNTKVKRVLGIEFSPL